MSALGGSFGCHGCNLPGSLQFDSGVTLHAGWSDVNAFFVFVEEELI